jgi:hypothetical protein
MSKQHHSRLALAARFMALHRDLPKQEQIEAAFADADAMIERNKTYKPLSRPESDRPFYSELEKALATYAIEHPTEPIDVTASSLAHRFPLFSAQSLGRYLMTMYRDGNLLIRIILRAKGVQKYRLDLEKAKFYFENQNK